MTRITIISCIIAAVCVFQTAEARLLNKSPNLGSLLGGAQNGVSGALGNIKDMRENLQNHGQEILDGIKNGLQESVNALTSETCTKAYTEAKEAARQLGSAFNTCMVNAISSPQAKEKLERLNVAVYNLQSSVTKYIQDLYNCRQYPLLNMISCAHNVVSNGYKLNTQLLQEVVYATMGLTELFPDMRQCYDSAVQQAAKNIKIIGQDVAQCVQSAMKPFQYYYHVNY